MIVIPYRPEVTTEGRITDALRALESAVFYGPHPCRLCGDTIVKASRAQGGAEYDEPDGPIYPNTQWVPHTCRGRDAAPQPSVQS